MATRRIVRPAPTPASGEGSSGIEYKNIFRNSALDVRVVEEVSASSLYSICRTKSNQVMMMKRRGYIIPPEEQVWIECSLNEDVLIQQTRKLLGMKMGNIIKNVMNRVGNKAYTLVRQELGSQTAYTYYPYLESEGSDELKIGEFFFQRGQWNLERQESDLLHPVEYTTEVIYMENIQSSDYMLNSFSDVAGKILVHTGDEKNFRKELENMVWYRRQGVEIFHMTELYIDYFQHWLVPKQEILTPTNKIRALSSHLMVKTQTGKFEKMINCQINEQSLPSVHHTDIVIRYIGALPGHIVYWENESYISSFITQESGYMLVVGHKYAQSRAEETTFTGERIPGQPDDNDDDMDDDMEDIDEEDVDEDGGVDDYED